MAAGAAIAPGATSLLRVAACASTAAAGMARTGWSGRRHSGLRPRARHLCRWPPCSYEEVGAELAVAAYALSVVLAT